MQNNTDTTEPRIPGPRKKLKEGTFFGFEVGKNENRKVVDPRTVYKLAAIGFKNSEIARFVEVDEATLGRNFIPELLAGRKELHCSLRQAQIRLALSGNAVMLIWLGKNLLGQSDNPIDTEDRAPLPWTE